MLIRLSVLLACCYFFFKFNIISTNMKYFSIFIFNKYLNKFKKISFFFLNFFSRRIKWKPIFKKTSYFGLLSRGNKWFSMRDDHKDSGVFCRDKKWANKPSNLKND